VVVGSGDNAYYATELINTIPFDFGDGSYNYALKKDNGQAIPFGVNS
tara:strand:- start:463 stop:603 length:141 start_codon:yes stop_codon:yes gene_type:complete